MNVTRILTAAALAVLVASPALAQQDTTHGKVVSAMARTNAGKMQGKDKQKENLKAEAKISKDSAKVVALAQVPGGKVKSSELEREKGTIVYSFDISVKGKSGIEEVLVSAIDGSVVSHEHETPKMEKAEAKKEKAEAKKEKAETKKP